MLNTLSTALFTLLYCVCRLLNSELRLDPAAPVAVAAAFETETSDADACACAVETMDANNAVLVPRCEASSEIPPPASVGCWAKTGAKRARRWMLEERMVLCPLCSVVRRRGLCVYFAMKS